MNTDMNTVRLLGAAQLFVFLASMVSERLLESAAGTGEISDKLVNMSSHLTLIRISNLVALLNSLGIVVLGVLFYVVFNGEYQVITLVALGAFVAEGIALAVSKLGTYALIPLSQELVAAGAPEPYSLQMLGEFLCEGVYRRGYDIHMLFFCLGGILWYTLLVVSGDVPRALSIWSLAAVSLLSIPVVVGPYDRKSTRLLVLGLPYAPFELALGVWLIIRGFNSRPQVVMRHR